MRYDPAIEELKDAFCKTAFKNKKKTIQNAIEMAYADMSRRQTGHTPAMKEICVNWLVNEVFIESLQITDFSVWHENTCMDLVDKMNTVTPGFGTVGKAQKVVNMIIKYLFCISDQYSELSEHSHMTLDGYTLEWYKLHVISWAKDHNLPVPDDNIQWSKIKEYADYMCIQNGIRQYLQQIPEYYIAIGSQKTVPVRLPDRPFDAEFIIWEGNIIKEKYSRLIKALNHYKQGSQGKRPGREKDTWLIGSLFDDFLHEYCKNL